MRAVTLLIWILTAVCCFAQQAEKKLLDRVTGETRHVVAQRHERQEI